MNSISDLNESKSYEINYALLDSKTVNYLINISNLRPDYLIGNKIFVTYNFYLSGYTISTNSNMLVVNIIDLPELSLRSTYEKYKVLVAIGIVLGICLLIFLMLSIAHFVIQKLGNANTYQRI